MALLAAGHAAAAGWIDLHPPSTARLTRLAASGSVLLAGSDSGRIYRSSDAGARWTRGAGSKGYPVRALLIDGQNAYAARSDIYNPLADCFSSCVYPPFTSDVTVSRDGGATWTSDSLYGVQSLARGRDGTVWAMGGNRVYHLPAGKTQWIQEPFRLATGSGGYSSGSRHNSQGLAVREPYLMAVIDNFLFAASLSHSGDSLRFDRLSDDSTFALVGDSTQSLAANRGGLWKITLISPTPQLVKVNATRFAWLALDNGVLLGAEKNGPALRSVDGGTTWKPIGEAAAAAATSAAVTGADAFAVAPNGEILTSRASAPWTPAMAGIEETRSAPVLVAGGRVYARTYLGLRRVPAGGGIWDSIPGMPAGTSLTLMAATQGWLWAAGGGLWRGRPGSADAWEQVAGDPVHALAAEGKRVIAAIDRTAGSGAPYHVLLICDDGEACRETAPGQLGNSTLGGWPTAVYSRLNGLVVHGDTLMATDKTMYRSVDGGKTWDTPYTLETGSSSGKPYALSGMTWLGTGLIAGMHGGAANCYPCLYRSPDLGVTWDRLDTSGIPVNPSAPLAAGGRLYANASLDIYASPDTRNWSPLGFPGGTYVLAKQADADWMAASGTDEKLWSLKLDAPVVGTRGAGKAVRAGPAHPAGAAVFQDRSGRPRRADGRVRRR